MNNQVIRPLLHILVAGLALTACHSNRNSGNGPAGRDTTGNAPVETQKPNANYAPAFAGQNRIQGIKTTTPYRYDIIARDLGRPWAIVTFPDGHFLVTEKSGHMLWMDADGNILKKITGIPEVDDRDQGGLLDVAPDPDYEHNRLIYWSFSERQTDGANLLAVAKGKLNIDAGIVESPVVIFRATPALKSTLHFGSRLVFDKDSTLFVSTGERSILEGREQAQWLHSHLGKIFRITRDGQPAPGNPFLNQAGAQPAIYAYGIRNCQSLDFHPLTGELWAAEFGPRGGDELNIIKPGRNYGWPVITYGIEYSGKPIGDAIQQKPGMEQPVYYWDPVLSPSGMSFYRGSEIPEWENNLFIGGLSSTHICRLKITDNKVVGEERLLESERERFRDVACVAGKIYAVTDGGKLYRLQKK